MPKRSYPDLDGLIREIENTAAEEPDPLDILVSLLRVVINSEADPYLLAGALAEGLAETIAKRIPRERRGAVAVETVRVLMNRMKSHGLL